MELQEVVNVILNSGISVGVIIYFMWDRTSNIRRLEEKIDKTNLKIDELVNSTTQLNNILIKIFTVKEEEAK